MLTSEDFDSIQHDSTLAWFKSYLSLRMQVLRIGSVLSDPLPQTVGVARGPFSVQLC